MTRARGPAVLAVAAVAWLAGPIRPVPAQSAKAPPRTVFTNRAAFSLPVKIDDRDRAELKELKFYVKAVQAGLPGEWVCKETAAPSQSKFAFRAAQDGEYWFAFVTVDKAGNVAPADLDREPPGLVVVVDTQAPVVDVRPATAVTGETFLQCQAWDSHPEPASVKLEYQSGDKTWRALDTVPGTPGLYRAPSAEVLKGVIRASVADKAGNKTAREIDLSQPIPPAPTLGRDATVLTSATRPAPAPAAAARVTEKSILPPPFPTPRPASVEPPVVATRPTTVEPPASASRLLVNNLRCTLDYALDTGHSARVEAYATRDGGRTWTRVGEGRSPMSLQLPEEGTYGIALAVGTATQAGAAPTAGDMPELWLEVDTAKPEVLVHGVQAGTGTEARVLSMAWSAQDRNLTADAVEIHGAASPDGPWQPLVRGLKDKGTVQCAVPADLGWKVYLRVQASDKAGNVGRWETREPVLLEGAKPKARVLGVTAGK